MNSVYLLSKLRRKRAHTSHIRIHYIECAEPIQRNSAACKQYDTKCQTRKMNETETVNAMFESRNDHYHRDDQHYNHHHHYRHYRHRVAASTAAATATIFVIERNEFCVRVYVYVECFHVCDSSIFNFEEEEAEAEAE